jgi:hypothetical protein
MFTVEERARTRARLIEMARADPRVVSGAELGSLTLDRSDRWGDLDLTFGVENGVDVHEVFDGWTQRLRREDGAIRLFDLAHRGTLYRVFLYPNNLQVDLSLSPGGVVGMGPKLRMLFGDRVTHIGAQTPDAEELLGLAAHHALRARIYVARARFHHAASFVGERRNETLSLSSLRRGLPARYGRGFDDLPDDVKERAAATFVRSIEPDEILRALFLAIELLIDEAQGIGEIDALAARLRTLMTHDLV